MLDDGWSDVERDGQGQLQADPARFPGGMAVVAACVQRQGLQLGLYADSGSLTCQGFPGSRGHERQDAQTFARWGARVALGRWCWVPLPPCVAVLSRGEKLPQRPALPPSLFPPGARLLKYDTCYAMDDVLERFAAMRDALNATNTPILYMLCEWVSSGATDPAAALSSAS